MAQNYYIGNEIHPYHVSVGAVLLNKENQVCCHYFKKIIFGDNEFEDIYILMRETPEPEESLEHCLARGLQEEFGLAGKLVTYIGSIRALFKKSVTTIEKTTLYFICKLDEGVVHERGNDVEAQSEMQWQTPDFLIQKMKEQNVRYNREDADESTILEKVKLFLKNNE